MYHVGLWGDEVCMLTHTYPHKPLSKIKWLYIIARMTAHFKCGLMSNLVICKHRKKVLQYITLNVLTETRCETTKQMSNASLVLETQEKKNNSNKYCIFSLSGPKRKVRSEIWFCWPRSRRLAIPSRRYSHYSTKRWRSMVDGTEWSRRHGTYSCALCPTGKIYSTQGYQN